MGCGQSDTGNIVVPMSQRHSSIVSSSNALQTLISMAKNSQKKQVNDMPNDEFHFQFMDHARNLCAEKKLEEAQGIADKLFELGYIDEAIEIYQKIISNDPSYKSNIQGLGCLQLGVSYYEWHVFKTYDEKRKANLIKSSPYDALSLCYTLIVGLPKYTGDLKKGEIWYRSMVEKYPENVGILMGLGNIFGCLNLFDQAIQMYEKVILLRPDFIYAYASLGMIYEYKRINFAKANQYATKIIELVNQNPYSDFILAKNSSDIDIKIAKLKEAKLKHPEYTRIINEIGICYGATKKDYTEAIEWYKQCIEQSPEYYSPYNNIGVNNELMLNYDEARKWYYMAVEVRSDYAAPHDNLTDVYITLKWTDQQIEEQFTKHEKIDKGTFCWQVGKAFYNKKTSQNYNRAIIWGEKSVQINPNNADFWNQLGISYDENGKYEKAIAAYQKAIEINPELALVCFNLAIAYKSMGKMDQCEKSYRKSVQIDPRYSYAWNNLGNIYKNGEKYEEAVQFYQHAVEFNSTYTLALANLGICLLKLQKYKDAFTAFSRAKEALPNDKNNLNEANKIFLRDNLALFDKEGQKWKKTGSVTDEEKQSLKMLIEQFQKKFKNIANAVKAIEVSTEKIFNPQILEIIKIIQQDKFQLSKIEEIFDLVQIVFHEDEEYFHIIPLLVIQNFTKEVFEKKKEITQTEDKLRNIMKKIAGKVSQKQAEKNEVKIVKNIELKLAESKITNSEVNLFKETTFFKSYEELYIEVNKVNAEAKKSYSDFSLLVEETRKKSNGIPGGISTKIPVKPSEQFKVMLRIMQKMFKKEIDQQRTLKLITQINRKLQQVQSPTLDIVVKEIMNSWNNQITSILKDRNAKKIETKFSISDLLRARCLYNTVDDLLKAVRVVDGYCKVMNYEVIELDNRLMKPQTQDVVFKIRIKNAVCELQLAMKQDEVLTHLDHCVYEILRSPLGVIFGSYLFMSKEVKYPLTANCKDIMQKSTNSDEEHMKRVKDCAEYVLTVLQGKN